LEEFGQCRGNEDQAFLGNCFNSGPAKEKRNLKEEAKKVGTKIPMNRLQVELPLAALAGKRKTKNYQRGKS